MSGKRWGDIESSTSSSPEEADHISKLNSFSVKYSAKPNVKHWGEMETEQRESHAPDVMEDIEKSMNKFCLPEFDSDYDGDNLHRSERVCLPAADPLILYAISLHKYFNDLMDVIVATEQANESRRVPPENTIEPIPEMPDIPQKHVKNNLNYVPKEFTPFSLGDAIDIPELSEAVVKQILIKCVATLTAHIGFETTHQSVLDVLTDVLETFLVKISQRLKIAQEDEDNDQLYGFPNIAERVLIEMGLGGAAGLHDYYQARIIKYVGVLQKRCKELREHHAKLLVPKSSASPVDSVSKNKKEKVVEEDVNESDFPEVHFSTIVGEVGLTLETGFQLLNSLEAETNLQKVAEAEEDVNLNTSPGILSIPETDITSNLSPFAKKKRNK